MNKAIKIILLVVLGVPLLGLLLVAGVFMFKDANDFKPAIEEQARNAAGLQLSIEGNLSWSIIPIGLDINKISIKDQALQDFASADRILASIDFWSLFSGAPKVETILLDGLKLNLIQFSETENNWSNVLPAKADTTKSPESKPEAPAEESPENSLNFLVESFKLINTGVKFESKKDELLLNIDPLNLTLSNITFDKAFPISLDFALSEKKNQLDLSSELNALLSMSKDLSVFSITDLKNSVEINAPQYSKEPIKIALSTEIKANTKTENVSINTLKLIFNELRINANVAIANYSNDLALDANVDLPVFSLKELLTQLNISLPPMLASDALEKVAVSADIKLEKQLVSINGLNIKLDESSWTGNLSHALGENPQKLPTKLKLHGNKLNLDRYLPPASDEPAPAAQEQAKASPTNAETELLPLDTLRDLNIDISVLQDSLSIKNINTQAVNISLIAKDGKLSQSLSGKLYEGSYSLTNKLNAQTDTPVWQTEQSITNLNLAPVVDSLNLEALKEYGSIKGMLNFAGKFDAKGNYLTPLMNSATGNVNFSIDQGAFEGLSLNALSCKGLALINKETLDTSSWPNATPFKSLKGDATLAQQNLSTNFDIITAGLQADSKGQINIDKSELSIKAILKIIGESEQHSCRVNEKLKNVGIPVICEGSFTTPPAELCKLDTSRLGNIAKDLAVEEGKRKINKEVDRALEKHLGGDDKQPVKSLLKKFIN